MNNIYKYVICAAVAMTAMTSCSDFLDAENKASVEADEYFATETGKSELRTTLYNSTRWMGTSIAINEWGTDLYAITRSSAPSNFHTYLTSTDDGEVKSYYQNAYAMIQRANCLIQYAGDNPQYAAEAKFIRCMGYYYLTQHFGAVPYVTQYIETAERNYPRTPLAEIYSAMIAELESIKNDSALPEEDHNGCVSRKAVAALLAKVCLAAGWDLETTLTNDSLGTYTVTATNYFSKAAAYATEAIGGRPLSMTFADKWAPQNEGNDEEIFSIQYERAGFPGDILTGGHSLQNNYGSGYGNPVENGMKSCSGGLVPSEKAIYLWDKDDERYEGTFMTTIYNYTGTWGTTGYYAYYNASEDAKKTMPIMGRYFPWWANVNEVKKYVNDNPKLFTQGSCPAACYVVIMSNPAVAYTFNKTTGKIAKTINKEYNEFLKGEGMTSVTHCVKKFDDPQTPQANSASGYRDIVMLHLSDMYLTAAEAYLMAGDEQKALQYINSVRNRAKTAALASFADYKPAYTVSDNFQVTPLDVLLDERARETYAEQTRWMDLRRTRQLVRYNKEFNSYIDAASDMANSYGQIKWYRPIPAAEIETNSALTVDDQNPGY